MTVARTLRHSRVVFACRFFGVATAGIAVLLGLHDESFDDCVARPLVGSKQEELRVFGARFFFSIFSPKDWAA